MRTDFLFKLLDHPWRVLEGEAATEEEAILYAL